MLRLCLRSSFRVRWTRSEDCESLSFSPRATAHSTLQSLASAEPRESWFVFATDKTTRSFDACAGRKNAATDAAAETRTARPKYTSRRLFCVSSVSTRSRKRINAHLQREPPPCAIMSAAIGHAAPRGTPASPRGVAVRVGLRWNSAIVGIDD